MLRSLCRSVVAQCRRPLRVSHFSSVTAVHGDYDVCVIGSGPAGYAAAMRAYDFGKKVCLVEKAKMGGAGVWDGAMSSKVRVQTIQAQGGSQSLVLIALH
jgi:ribulose 1,5-bisphosphate synthetase/thiazole synthase